MPAFWKSNPSKNDPEYLFSRAQKGDVECLEDLLQMYRDSLSRWLHASFRDLGDLVEDAIQEAFFQIARDIESVHLRSSFRTYLYSVARNRCRDIIRRSRSRGEESIDDESAGEIADLQPSETDKVDSKTDLAKALTQLSDYERLIVKLYYVNEAKLRVIAQLVGKSIAQVSRDLEKVRKKLGDLLEV